MGAADDVCSLCAITMDMNFHTFFWVSEKNRKPIYSFIMEVYMRL